MVLVILTPVKLLGEGLADCLNRRPDVQVLAVLADLAALRLTLRSSYVDVVLVDATQGVQLEEMRALAIERPDVALVALGLREHRHDVIRCGQAGFLGYVSRDASVEHLYSSLADVLAGRQACPAEISGGLLRALFRGREVSAETVETAETDSLTRREFDVFRLIGRGFTNKEIARELRISIATVKHHVHHVLEKLHVPRRAQAMRRARDFPWNTDGDAVPARSTNAQ